MPHLQIQLPDGIPDEIGQGLALLRDKLGVETVFGPDVLADADARIAAPELPQQDMTSIPFVTIDPEGSMDLDQAMYIERDGAGYVVRYAIDDVAAWVRAGGPMDADSHRRGQTFYAPNERYSLYPPQLSEAAASLLPQDPPRPALVWTMRVAADGALTDATVVKALVRSTAKLTYTGVQAAIDDGSASDSLKLLREVGQLREAQERARGGVSLAIPDQEVHADGEEWVTEFRRPLPVEGWNAQISLMTGMAAATIMLDHKVGILRTLPPVDPASLARLRRAAKGLHIDWPKDMGYPEFLRTLDSSRPTDLAMLQQCTTLFRGAGYVAFNGELPTQNVEHNALATTYAHTTAPLRRLVDRYVLETCACLVAGLPVPAWVTDQFATLPDQMQASNKKEKAFERGIVDLVEALILANKVGQTFTGTVVEAPMHGQGGRVLITSPAIEAAFHGDAPLGEEIQVRLKSVDLVNGIVAFTL